MYCDYNIERYVRNKYFDYLKELAPEKRAAENSALKPRLWSLKLRKPMKLRVGLNL